MTPAVPPTQDMMSLIIVAATCLIACGAAGYWLTGKVLQRLHDLAILDLPNDRSSHSIPTPRGGGWAVMITLIVSWALIGLFGDRLTGASTAMVWPVLGLAAALMAISWVDDRRGLGPAPRFLAQILAVAIGCLALPSDGLVFQGILPLWADRLIAGIGWLWFVNLFNFMDGIDGLAGGEAASIGVGVAIIALISAGTDPVLVLYGVAAAGAAVGFLGWNWHPAKLFMGDVGSIPLGYTLGWLLLMLAATGQWVAALLIPAYFLTDATWTLLRRLLQGKKIWQAHREHFYQRATQAGRSHAEVSRSVLLTNAVLIALAVASVTFGWLTLAGGLAAIALLLLWMAKNKSVVA